MPPPEYSYVDAYLAIQTVARLAEDGVRLLLSFSPREGHFEIQAYGWPFEKSDSLDSAPIDAARDVPRTFDGTAAKGEAPCWAASPSLTEAIETVLDAYARARAEAPSQASE